MARSSTVAPLLLAMACALLAGCSLVATFSSSAREASAGGGDRSVDGVDDAADAGPPPDVSPAPDASLDVGPPDVGVDVGPPACGVVAQREGTVAPGMVLCKHLLAAGLDQCGAGALCGPGWSLCGAVEYRQRFADGPIAPFAEAWLGSCVRAGGVQQEPSDAVCDSCLPGDVPPEVVAESCDGTPVSVVSADQNVGLVTADVCRGVGAEPAGAQAFWSWQAAGDGLVRALCCEDGCAAGLDEERIDAEMVVCAKVPMVTVDQCDNTREDAKAYWMQLSASHQHARVLCCRD